MLDCQNKLSDARNLVGDLTIHTIPISEVILKLAQPSILTISHNDTPYPLSTHHPNTTLRHYLTRRLNHWLDNVRPRTSRMSSLDWSSLTWNLAGTTISASRKSPYHKTFLFKVLYDALPNEFTKYKYSMKLPPDYDPQSDPDLPACPLCHTCADSLSHLFCNCPDPTISTVRSKLISDLHSLPTNIHPTHPSFPSLPPVLALIMTNFYNSPSDHRNLLGLFKLSTISPLQQPFTNMRSALTQVALYTIPYLQTVWKLYCTQLHNSSPTPSPHPRPHLHSPSTRSFTSNAPRVIILSGNNATMSLQTVNDHVPTLYTRKTRRKPRPTPITSTHTQHSINSSTSSTITHYFPLTQPFQHSQIPTPISPITPPSPTHSPTSPKDNTSHSSFFIQDDPTTSTCPPSPFLLPKRTARPSSHQTISTPQTAHTPPHLPFSTLDVYDIATSHNEFTFTHSHQSIKPLPHIDTASKSTALKSLQLHAHDVPPNGDCFYLTIQLYLLKMCSPPQHTSSRLLRQRVYNLLTQTKSGKQILREHNQSPTTAAINILPNLRPALYPNRDVYASDLAISAMATLLQTTIKIYSFNPRETLLLYEYKPYPPQNHSTLNTTSPIPHTLWAQNSHFQLLLPHIIPLSSITNNLLPLPPLQSTNHTTASLPIIIPNCAPTLLRYAPPLFHTVPPLPPSAPLPVTPTAQITTLLSNPYHFNALPIHSLAPKS